MNISFKPEPIAIPVAAGPSSMDLPLSAAGGGPCGLADALDSSSYQDLSQAGGASSSTDPKAAARQQDSDRLIASLSNSEIQPDELQMVCGIGHGSSGNVSQVLHVPTSSVLALKSIPVDADEASRKAILLELKALHDCMHPAIVSFYGAFFREGASSLCVPTQRPPWSPRDGGADRAGAVHIALEYMDASLLDILRCEAPAALPEPMLGAIARPVLEGLVYLHREKHLIHRDIKPSNLLIDKDANVKIADFGVSGEMSCTLSKKASWVGTVHYMSPERISGGSYSYDSDMWSLGITLLELATAAFPYGGGGGGGGGGGAGGGPVQRLGYWDLLDLIVESPPPTPPAHFSPAFADFIGACLQKQPEARASSTQLRQHALLALHAPADLASWAQRTLAKIPARGRAGGPGSGASGDATEQAGGSGSWHGSNMGQDSLSFRDAPSMGAMRDAPTEPGWGQGGGWPPQLQLGAGAPDGEALQPLPTPLTAVAPTEDVMMQDC